MAAQARLNSSGVVMSLIELCERGLIPDALTRQGIRRLCAQRLVDEGAEDLDRADSRFRALLDQLRQSPIAIETAAANEQHYELPTRFFQLCLGKRLKYSSCFYPTGEESLDQAEEAMLALYAERAELADGQDILELGCGWGSLTLWMAERYPNARITAVSNSATQRASIEAICAARG
ncbi:MAG: class I SAM-dependent methyltransferase, partial [Arenimonas sp.]|nr:class I SAM-dependent methyltransferase [Arenimonas sp.]